MARRHLIICGAAILAIALSVPAIGNGTDWFGLAERASERAKEADQRAKRANRQATRALRRATRANQRSKRARSRANRANRRVSRVGQRVQRLGGLLDGTRVVSATAPGLVTSNAPMGQFEALGGPSVEVTVPSSGLIEVWAQADIGDENGGAVALYEDGKPVPGISEAQLCGHRSVLIDFQGTGGNGTGTGGSGGFLTFSSPPTLSLVLGCGTPGAPGSVILERPPGERTYELRYSECSCGGEARFRNRVLRVAPRL